MDFKQIWKKSNMVDFYVPRSFYGQRGIFVEHIKLHLCVKFQVIKTKGVRGVAKLWILSP